MMMMMMMLSLKRQD